MKTKRPWGYFEILSESESYKIKLLSVNPHQSLSLQKHLHRKENWIIIKGNPIITVYDIKFEAEPNKSFLILEGVNHRIENKTNDIVEIIEIQTGKSFDEDDIIRYEDKYNRVTIAQVEERLATD